MERFQVPASQAALCCVLEQDTLSFVYYWFNQEKNRQNMTKKILTETIRIKSNRQTHDYLLNYEYAPRLIDECFVKECG